MSGLLLRDAELGGWRRADVRIDGEKITEIAPALARQAGERTVHCGGGALIPGLCDHHLHLHALAAQARSVCCGPPRVTGREELSAAVRGAMPDEHGWIRGVGYIESIAGELDASALDALHAGGPVRIQHRSGAMWMLNSAAVREAGLGTSAHPGIERDARGRPTGRLWRADDWLRDRLPPARPLDLAPVGRLLAGLGITAVTDATPDLGPAAAASIATAVRAGSLPRRVHLLGLPLDGPGLDGPRARRPGSHRGEASARPGITAGPYKIVLADSGLPGIDDLVGRIRHAHDRGRPVAVHCVTREALLLLIAAFRSACTLDGDRVEHAALVPRSVIADLAGLGLRVVTQPGFLADRGDDYLREVTAEDRPDLYRCASLLDAGIPIGLSSDAPYGPLDPWEVMAAAARRRTPSGAVVGAAEAISPRAALRSYLTPPGLPGGVPRRVRAGAPADLVLLRVPLAEALARPSATAVRLVISSGRPLTG